MNIHEETLKIARNLIKKDPSLTNWVVSKFPELKDEDERIRKELIDFVKSRLAGFPQCEKFIDWLKKQGNNKLIWKHWSNGIAGNGAGKLIYLIKEGNNYRLSSYLAFECDYIELSELDNLILEKQGEQKPTIIIPKFRVGDEIKTTNETPLTITKIDEKGYWSESLFICSFDNADKWKLVEQKPAWSEEDEKLFNRICDLIHEAAYENCETNEDGKELGEYAKMMRLLKFLKERCHWKPSEEQLRELENVFSPDTDSWDEDVLRELYKQLKQL